ncbi:MAG: EAL domain-containing protein [Gammaproteobacteria bacterium]|nr:EAL domain-containing protein [Gammaproteobacteria bacterium]
MNEKKAAPAKTKIKSISLPLKISGIVFWGMVLIGIIASLILIKDFNQSQLDKYNARVQATAFSVSQILSLNPDINNEKLRTLLQPIPETHQIDGFRIESKKWQVNIGQYNKTCNPYITKFKTPALNANGSVNNTLSVCLPDIEKVVTEYRRDFLVMMIIIFFSFGMLLQLILKKILTSPFMSMVDTANNILNGKTKHRFNEQRDDEFGFISKFINQALEQQVKKSAALEEALQHLQKTDTALTYEKDRAEITLESISEAVISTDQLCCVQSLNSAAEHITGWNISEVKGKPLSELLSMTDYNSGEKINLSVKGCDAKQGKPIRLNGILTNNNNKAIDINLSAAPIYDNSKEVTGIVVVLQDVGTSRELERQLSYQASHDWLTGLYNRSAFDQQLRQLIENAKNNKQQHALCYLDLDRFKIVNDTCGHVAGDEMLKQIADMFQAHIRSTDTLARLGGDEFGLLLSNCSVEKAHSLAEKLRQSIDDFHFHWDGKYFEIGVSVGIVVIDENSERKDDILASADIACYTAKENGRNCIHIYKPEGLDLERRRGETQWLDKIKNAFTNDRFCLYFQPIISLADPDTKDMHVEILIRMIGDDNKIIPPMAFLPAAERYMLMPQIDRWVIKHVLATISSQILGNNHEWPSDRNYLFNINLSGESIANQDLLSTVQQLLTRYHVPAHVICFEITESVAISNLENARNFIDAMRNLGCKFALDDFGSGMCSFSYLKNLSVDYLKIDGSYVKGINSSNIDKELVMAVNHIGHVFGMQTVAEFVENKQVLQTLMDIGVDYAQGYGIEEPRPVAELFALPEKVISR